VFRHGGGSGRDCVHGALLEFLMRGTFARFGDEPHSGYCFQIETSGRNWRTPEPALAADRLAGRQDREEGVTFL